MIKRILYLAVMLLTFVPVLTDCGSVYAQRMASEISNPYSPWNQADKTGQYYMERCQECGAWITGNSEYQKRLNMEEHMSLFHSSGDSGTSDWDDDGDVIIDDNGNTLNSTDFINVVDIESAAEELEKAGICNARYLVDDYSRRDGRYVFNKHTVLLSNFLSYLRNNYRIKEYKDFSMLYDDTKWFCLLSKFSRYDTLYYFNASDGNKYLFYNITATTLRELRFFINKSYELILVSW